MSQPQITNYNRAKIFLYENDYQTATYTNGTGSEVTLAEGTVLGRILSSNKVRDFKSDAVDGSQFPMGVLMDDVTVANGASATVTYCVEGWVAQDKLVFTKNGDGLTTSVGTSGKVKDLLQANTHITLKETTEHTSTDNQ